MKYLLLVVGILLMSVFDAEAQQRLSGYLRDVTVKGEIRTRGNRRQLQVRWEWSDEDRRFAARTVFNFAQGSLPRRKRSRVSYGFFDYSDFGPDDIRRGGGVMGQDFGFKRLKRRGFTTRFGQVTFSQPFRWRSTRTQKLRGKGTVRLNRL